MIHLLYFGTMPMKKEILPQLDALIETGKRLADSFQPRMVKDVRGQWLPESYRPNMAKYVSKSNVPLAEHRAFVTSSLAAIERIAGKDSQYYENIPQKIKSALHYGKSFISIVTGVLVALRDAVDQGLLQSLESKLRANIHDDFLVQSSELLDAGYHVAALVLTGGVLEDHLQKMIQARGLRSPRKGSISKYNDVLRDNAYHQPVWRRIQSIGDLRNAAAHIKSSTIAKEDAKDAHTYVQRFVADYPA